MSHRDFFMLPIFLHHQNKKPLMSKKETIKYDAKLDQFADKKIYINVNHLEKGDYELSIINKNKLIIKTHFKK